MRRCRKFCKWYFCFVKQCDGFFGKCKATCISPASGHNVSNNHSIRESLRIEKTLKIIKANHQLSTAHGRVQICVDISLEDMV